METNKETPNKFVETFIKPNLPKTKKEWFWFMLIILVVITLGVVAVNQYLAISYKATLINAPCNLCEAFQRDMRNNMPGGTLYFNISNITINNPLAT